MAYRTVDHVVNGHIFSLIYVIFTVVVVLSSFICVLQIAAPSSVSASTPEGM